MSKESDKYRLLIENLPDAFASHQIVTNQKGAPVDYIFREINDAFEDMTGLKRKDAIGKKVTEVLPGIENSEFNWISIYGRVALTGEAIRFESYSEPLGRYYDVSAFSDDHGYFSVVFRDITSYKTNEETLRAEQREKEIILNNLAEQVSFLDPEMHIIWANSKIIERHNLSNVEYKGQKCFELYHQLDEPCPDCPVVEAFKTGKTCSGIHKSPDGSYWQVTGVPVHDQNGAIIGVMDTALEITDLIESREALRESEAYVKTIMDNLPIGVAVNSVEPEVVFTYMNDNFPKFYHTTKEKLSDPGAFWDVIYEDPRFREEIKKRVEDDCAAGDPEKMLWKNVPVTRDGKVVAYISASNTPVPEKALMISTVWDVTASKIAEDALQANYALLRLAGETARFGGWSVDLSSNLCSWSDQVAKIHEMPAGYAPPVDEGIRFYAPEWREKITEVFTACAEKGISYDEEMQIITAKGRRVWVRTTGEAVRDKSGKIIRVQGSFQDITEKYLMHNKAKKEHQQLLSIFNSIDEMIYISDPETYEILFVNNKLRNLLQKDCIGGLCYKEFQGFDSPCEFCSNPIIMENKSEPYYWEYYNPNLNRHYKLYDRIIKWPDGRNVRFEMASDITDSKEAEAEVRRLNEELEQRVKERTIQLEAVNKELEAFAYSVSHDLRAPLRALDGFSANLKSKYDDHLDDQGRHYLERIHKAALYMSDLIDDLLKLSQVTRAEFKRQQVNLSKLSAEILAVLQEAEPQRKVKIEVLPGLTAGGDVRLLRVVMENLLGNAWKFSAKDEEAQIKVGRIIKDEDEVIFVRDNGAGFDMAYADKLFKPFQRLHEAEEFPGTGVGLATVQRVINRHGGKVWAESEVGRGATFYFTLPG